MMDREELLQLLNMNGFLTIQNTSAGAVFADNLMRWHVEYEVRTAIGFKIKMTIPGDIEPALKMIWDMTKEWKEKYRPDELWLETQTLAEILERGTATANFKEEGGDLTTQSN